MNVLRMIYYMYIYIKIYIYLLWGRVYLIYCDYSSKFSVYQYAELKLCVSLITGRNSFPWNIVLSLIQPIWCNWIIYQIS